MKRTTLRNMKCGIIMAVVILMISVVPVTAQSLTAQAEAPERSFEGVWLAKITPRNCTTSDPIPTAIVEGLAQQPTVEAAGLAMSIQPGKTNTAPQPGTSQAVFLPHANHLTPLDKAYLDAFSILKEDNTCSAFYGGPSAIQVLNELKQQFKPAFLDSTVAVRMTGKTRKILSRQHPLSYRLFDKAELNLDGPFYRGNALNSGWSIGGFLPNTREARVTILLHELGHLIESRDKQWLLPNDGSREGLVQENTKRVIAVCGKQIRRLSRISFTQQLQAARLTLPIPAIAANVLDP